MGNLSDSLRDMGFEPTGEESPVDEEGQLWSSGSELVCDKTGVVIDGNHYPTENGDNKRHRYRNSGRVKMYGAFLGQFDWGKTDNENQFRY